MSLEQDTFPPGLVLWPPNLRMSEKNEQFDEKYIYIYIIENECNIISSMSLLFLGNSGAFFL